MKGTLALSSRGARSSGCLSTNSLSQMASRPYVSSRIGSVSIANRCVNFKRATNNICNNGASQQFSFSTAASDAETVAPVGPKLTFAIHPFPINGTPIDLNAPSVEADRFAIVEFSGTQYKVTLDDTIVADKQANVDIGDVISLGKVLMVGSRKGTLMGRPYIEGAKVMAAVEEISKDKKLVIFKLRRRKNSRRKKGFRRSVTVLRIQNIILDEQHKEFNDKL